MALRDNGGAGGEERREPSLCNPPVVSSPVLGFCF